MILLQADPTVAATEAVKALEKGEFSQVIQQLISLGVEAGKSILLALLIFVVGRYVIKLINRVIGRMMERRKVEPTIQSFLKSFINVLLTILLIISTVSALGVNTTSFAALLASAGVAVGMALSGNLQNLAGGIILLLFKPYKVGDFIEGQGISGTVKEIQIFHTIILTGDNKQVYLPNGAMSRGNSVSYSKQPQRCVDLSIGIEYGADIDQVRSTLLEIFAADERILHDPKPFIALGNLSASSVDITIRLWVKSTDFWAAYFDTQETIYKTFNAKGISFPFPQLTIHNA